MHITKQITNTEAVWLVILSPLQLPKYTDFHLILLIVIAIQTFSGWQESGNANAPKLRGFQNYRGVEMPSFDARENERGDEAQTVRI